MQALATPLQPDLYSSCYLLSHKAKLSCRHRRLWTEHLLFLHYVHYWPHAKMLAFALYCGGNPNDLRTKILPKSQALAAPCLLSILSKVRAVVFHSVIVFQITSDVFYILMSRIPIPKRRSASKWIPEWRICGRDLANWHDSEKWANLLASKGNMSLPKFRLSSNFSFWAVRAWNSHAFQMFPPETLPVLKNLNSVTGYLYRNLCYDRPLEQSDICSSLHVSKGKMMPFKGSFWHQ